MGEKIRFRILKFKKKDYRTLFFEKIIYYVTQIL